MSYSPALDDKRPPTHDGMGRRQMAGCNTAVGREEQAMASVQGE